MFRTFVKASGTVLKVVSSKIAVEVSGNLNQFLERLVFDQPIFENFYLYLHRLA